MKTILDFRRGRTATKKDAETTFRHDPDREGMGVRLCRLQGERPLDNDLLEERGKRRHDNRTSSRLATRRDRCRPAEADARGVRIMIDAEETWLQDAIDGLAESMMRRHNTDRCVVFTTAQLYRHDRLDYIRSMESQARTEGWVAGVKLVRGAYMEKERERAAEEGRPSPIQPDKAATDRDFNAP